MDTKRFSEIWIGMFFLVSTIAISATLYLTVFVWQPIWTAGFNDFGQISKAIKRLDKTAAPVGAMAPLMLNEMDEMRKTMNDMRDSMKTIETMTTSMDRMTYVMEHRMGAMTYEMDEMGRRLSPAGMVPFNW